jgi:hypothetical protein
MLKKNSQKWSRSLQLELITSLLKPNAKVKDLLYIVEREEVLNPLYATPVIRLRFKKEGWLMLAQREKWKKTYTK